MVLFESFNPKNIKEPHKAENKEESKSDGKIKHESDKDEEDVIVSYMINNVKYEAHLPDMKSAEEECKNIVNRNMAEIGDVQINGKEWTNFKTELGKGKNEVEIKDDKPE